MDPKTSCAEVPPQGACTVCGEVVLGGFVWRECFGHLSCVAPAAFAALASDTIPPREADQAAELVDLYARGRVADARRRERHAGIARDIRGVVGLPTKERP
jgi:hypothetical protein